MRMLRYFSIFTALLWAVLHLGCKNHDIEGNWDVTIQYNKGLKRFIIPEKSTFRFAENHFFFINGVKSTGQYTKKGDYIRVLIQNRDYVVRGVLVDSNTINGEIKKILSDENIATWTGKRRQ